jgi:DNA relaxase NicK
VTARTKIDRVAVSIRDQKGPVFRACRDLWGHLGKVEFERGGGMLGFAESAMVRVQGAQMAMWASGGTSQKGRSYVDVTGLGCQHVREWDEAWRVLCELPEARLKRVDIAADFYKREVTYESTLDAYRRGKFARRGRPPKMRQILPGTSEEGRTVYIGSRGNDVMLRGYEKGKKEFGRIASRHGGLSGCSPVDCMATQSGESFCMADWFRLEVELHAVKRPLLSEVVPMRDQYFAGAYPFLSEVLSEVVPEILVYPQQIALATVDEALEAIRRQYGSTLFTALAVHSGDFMAVWDKIVGDEHSDRLLRAGALLAVVE